MKGLSPGHKEEFKASLWSFEDHTHYLTIVSIRTKYQLSAALIQTGLVCVTSVNMSKRSDAAGQAVLSHLAG